MSKEVTVFDGPAVDARASADALAAERRPLDTLICGRERARGFRAKEVGRAKTYDLVSSKSGLLAIQIPVD